MSRHAHTWMSEHPLGRVVLGMIAVVAVIIGTVLGTSIAVQATVPGTPGVPQASTLVYAEDFQNRPGPTPIVRLNGYTGATGQTYTAAAQWLTDCNGWIASAAQPVNAAAQVADCNANQASWNTSQRLAQAIGMFHGQTATQARSNFADTAFTSGNPGAGRIEFQTATNIPFVATNRFINFSVDVAAVNCGVSAPLLQFSLLNSAGAATNVGSQINGCAASTTITPPALGVSGATPMQVGTYTSNGALLFTGSSVGVRMINNNASGAGNDHTIDNIRIIDVTPQLDKSFSPTTRVAGQTSTLTLTVTNTSELAAKNGWSFTDALPAGLTVAAAATTTCPVPTLTAPVGGSSIALKANLSAGMASCTVTVPVTSGTAGTYTNGPSNITSIGLNPPANATVTFAAQAPALSIVKSATPAGFTDYVVGQTINYSFVVTNSGNVPITNVTVNETEFTGSGSLSAITCPAGAANLAVGAQVTCTASYVVTQADFDAGSITNAATATGTPPQGTPPVSPPSEFTVPSNDPAPSLSIVKTAAPTTVSNAGETVNYSFLVTNTGNVTLTDVSVSDDDFTGAGTLSPIVCPAGAASLPPAGQVTCTASYVVTQVDVDAGTISNTASASATPPSGPAVDTAPSTAIVTVPATPSLTVDKTADPAVAGAVGDTIAYSFLVTNTGNVTLSDAGIAEGTFTGTGDLSDIACPAEASSLPPQGQVTCTASYVLTQADVDNAQVANTATAIATSPDATPVESPSDQAVVDIPENAGITVVKTADDAALESISVGQTVDYSFLVTNTGNVSLSGIAITEGDFSGSGTLSGIVCPSGPLAAGAVATCTASYVVTQADVDSGQVTNSATATGTTPSGVELESAPSDEAVPAEIPAPALEIVKSATPTSVTTAGAAIAYSFQVTNIGNVTLTNVGVVEGEFTGTDGLSNIICPAEAASMAPGATVTCAVSYTVSQADIDSGEISNSATATGTPPTGPAIESEPSEFDVDVAESPSLTVVKTADDDAQAGYVLDQEITYSFVVTNTGNVTLTDAVVNEGSFSGSGELSEITCPAGADSLAPGASVTCTATYVATQADVDAGVITNSATATATPPMGDPVDSEPSDATTPAAPAAPALTIVKTADPITIVAAFDEITYSFVVTNTGNVTITDVGISEGAFSGTGELADLTCPAGADSLAPGASVTCTATYVASQADVDSGELTNTATATGTTPGGGPIESPPGGTTVEIPESASLFMVKTVDEAAAQQFVLGQTITYSFEATNTGNTTLAPIVINEGEFSGSGDLSDVTCPAEAASLAPGTSVTCTASYVATQADVDAGSIINTATASGTPPSGDTVTSDETNALITAVEADPSLEIVKSASPAAVTAVGSAITYSFLVTNTGNVSITDVIVNEGAFSGSGGLSEVTCPAAAASLIPGASITCTATYVTTQADVDAGEITNSATAAGIPPTGDEIESPPADTTVEIAPSPSLGITKSVDAEAQAAFVLGQTITYSFAVVNTGNVTLTDITVNEGDFTGTGDLSAVTCPEEADSLAPGTSVTCTATYVATQADVDAGVISNTASATGTPPTGDPVDSDPSDATTPSAPAEPSLSIVKTANPTAVSNVGDTITYSFLVTNTGNVTMTGITVAEGEFSGTGDLSAITCPEGAASLAPGATVTCTATYVATQEDVDSGSLTNSAVATGTPPDGEPVDSPPAETTVEITPAPSLSIVKTADEASQAQFVLGQTITYSFVVTNTGNVTIADVVVNEGEFSGSGDLGAIVCADGTASLAPGASVTCTATYVATQADVDAGEITNSATATGTPPGGEPVTSDPSVEETPGAPATPSLSIVKTADPASVVTAGETITYSFVVTNTGNVTITGVGVSEGDFTGSGDLSTITCAEGAASLAPGASVTCTATYVTSQVDIDSGEISNSATATGTPPSGPPIESEPGGFVVDVPASPSLTVVKSADEAALAGFAVGQQITYSFVVTNTGNVTLTDAVVNEGSFSGSGELSEITCPSGAEALAPGASVTCTATYTATQVDVDAGVITNSATATATPPTGDPVGSEPSDATTPATPAAPALTVVKTADPSTVVAASDVITYSFVVTNTGNVTVSGVAIAEGEFSGTGELSDLTCPAGAESLAPGASITCTATYAATQADVDSGAITNTATATGTTPGGDPIESPPGGTTVEIPESASLTVEKSVDEAAAEQYVLGQTITYSFEVTNTGNTTLAGVIVTEGAFSGSGTLSEVTCPAGAASLAPGTSVTCTATYVATQADVDAGEITNSATATGTPPSGEPATSDPSVEEAPAAPASPSLSVVKTADPAAVTTEGETITYSFVVTNTGNVTITDAAVSEGDFTGSGDLSEITCPEGAASLAPGASVTCTATYVTTQADIDSGEISNSATATGTPPSGPPIESEPGGFVVDVPASPSLTVVKSTDEASQAGFSVDQEITYSFVVTNTGNVTLTDAVVNEGSFSGSGELSEITCPDTADSLAPGASVTCTATYTATQADVDAGVITNSATATATPPTGDPVDSEPSNAETPSVPAAPSLTVEKTADPATIAAVGDTITYSFLVTNTGNVTISNAGIVEGEFSGTGELSAITCPAGAESLAPGASVTCTATYVATQADVDSGAITNAATATGTTPGGAPIDSPPGGTTVEIPAAPAMTILKSADPSTATTVGETITYSFVVTNTGNVTITTVSITEGEFSGTGTLSAITCPEGAASLAPGAQITCTSTYVLTQADVDSGELTNTANSTGTTPGGDPVDSPTDEVVVELPPTPAITVVKSADEAAQQNLVVGQTVTYSFLVTNTGTVTMADVGISDVDFSGSGELSEIVCPEGAASLAPGASVTCTATYVVTQADIDAGTVTNTATAVGTPPTGDPIESPESEVTVPGVATPGLDVVKTADVQRATTAGQVITYSFVATNTGNVTLTNVKIVEGAFTGTGAVSAISCPAGAASLAPGAQVTCTASYTVTAADLTAGSISNTATGTASTPDGGTTTSVGSKATVETPKILLLPNTGSDVRLGLGGAAALLAVGALLVLRRRRTLPLIE